MILRHAWWSQGLTCACCTSSARALSSAVKNCKHNMRAAAARLRLSIRAFDCAMIKVEVSPTLVLLLPPQMLLAYVPAWPFRCQQQSSQPYLVGVFLPCCPPVASALLHGFTHHARADGSTAVTTITSPARTATTQTRQRTTHNTPASRPFTTAPVDKHALHRHMSLQLLSPFVVASD